MWSPLDSIKQFEELIAQSKEEENLPFVVFKHSTRCSISSMALNRLNSEKEKLDQGDFRMFLLDLLQNRDLSDLVSKELNVRHESPQVLVVKNGHCVYHNSHMGIHAKDLLKHI